MNIEHFIPSDNLKPFIKTFMFIESEQDAANFVLPDTAMVMAFRYKGNVFLQENGAENYLHDAVFSGIRKSSRFIHYMPQTANLLVNFRPGGAAAFFYEPMNELIEQTVQADFLKSHTDFSSLADRLAAARTNSRRIAIIEQVLLSKLRVQQPDALVLSAVQKISLLNGNVRIRDLAKELYISDDAFEKRFRQSVGTSPKHFSSIIRLRNAIEKHVPGKSLTDTALTAGYYDQAHFIKDFKSFTGLPPLQFFKNSLYW